MSKLVIPDDVVIPPSTPYIGPEKPGAGEFEFSDSDDTTFRGLAGAIRFVATMSIVFGILQIVGGLAIGVNLRGLLTMGQGLLLSLVGTWLWSAGGSLRDVASTQGNDIMNLMYAMRKLKSVYTLQAWLMGLACVLLLATLAVALK